MHREQGENNIHSTGCRSELAQDGELVVTTCANHCHTQRNKGHNIYGVQC